MKNFSHLAYKLVEEFKETFGLTHTNDLLKKL